MASANGTSAQVVHDNTTEIALNVAGTAHNLRATRLVDDRKARGVPLEGPMTAEERERNVIYVIQVPLKIKEREGRDMKGMFPPGFIPSGSLFGVPGMQFGSADPAVWMDALKAASSSITFGPSLCSSSGSAPSSGALFTADRS